MLTVRDAAHAVLARRLRWMGNWPFEGERDRYWAPAMGNIVEPSPGLWPVNYCMGEPNCAVGRLLLRRLDCINARRQQQGRRFQAALAEFPELSFQKVPDGCEHVYHLMSARYDPPPGGRSRDDLIALLHDKHHLKCVVQYWPLYRSELFQKFGLGRADVPQTDRFFDNMISFPWWSDMSDKLIDDVAARTRAALLALRGAGEG